MIKQLSSLLFILLLSIIYSNLQAQPQLHIGYHQAIEFEESKFNTTSDHIPGLSAGLIYNVATSTLAGVEIGALISYNTLTDNAYHLHSTIETPYYTATIDANNVKATLNMINLNLPIRFTYTPTPIKPYLTMQFFAGVALNIGMKYKVAMQIEDQHGTTDLLKENIYNRFNLEVSAGLRAVLYDHYGINLSYNHGLLNLIKLDYTINGVYAVKYSHFDFGVFYQF